MQSENLKIQELSEEIEKIQEDRDAKNSSALERAAGILDRIYFPVKSRMTLKGHFGKIYAMHWAEDSKSIVSASQDGKLIIWNGFTGNMKAAIPIRSAWVMTVAFAPSRNFVACGGLDNLCSVYRITEAEHTEHKLQAELQKHEGYLSCCRFIDDENIISSSGDGTCILWDVTTRTAKRVFRGHETDVMSVSLIGDKNTFISGSTDSMAKIWDKRTGTCETTYGHKSDINSVDVMPNGSIPCFASGSDDSSCRLFDLRSVSTLQMYAEDKILCGITSVALSGSGRMLFAGYDDYSCLAWDTLKGVKAGECVTHTGQAHDNRVSCLGVSKDGLALCTGSWDTFLKIWA